MIVDYKIVLIRPGMLGGGTGKVEDEVKKLMKDGWQPLGGVSSLGDGMIMQAMIKYA